MIKKSISLGSKATYESPILQEEEIEERRIISTGCKNLDVLLAGGVKTREVTEFHGASHVGKTQLCYGLCVSASRGGIDGKAIFIDTEDSFIRERIREIAEKRGYDPTRALRNTVGMTAYSCNEQEKYLEKIEEQLSSHANYAFLYKLIVIDSVIANYKAEFNGRENLSSRQQRLYIFMKKLKGIANIHNIAVVITNHITEVPDMNEFRTVKPSGGNAMGYNITHRVTMEPRLGRYLAKIYSSRYLPDNKMTSYSIGHDGIKDY